MSGTVSFIDIATKGTFTGSIARVNFLDRHTGKLPFVFDKAMQLEESPAMEIVSLALAKPYPFADALEVFKNNTTSGAFKEEALAFLAREREKIMRMTHEEALLELVRVHKLESRITMIKSVRDNGILEIR